MNTALCYTAVNVLVTFFDSFQWVRVLFLQSLWVEAVAFYYLDGIRVKRYYDITLMRTFLFLAVLLRERYLVDWILVYTFAYCIDFLTKDPPVETAVLLTSSGFSGFAFLFCICFACRIWRALVLRRAKELVSGNKQAYDQIFSFLQRDNDYRRSLQTLEGIAREMQCAIRMECRQRG